MFNSITGNITKLFSANLVAQIIGFAVYPILTRYYSPADFGIYNLFATILGICIIVSTVDIQYAIPLPKEEKTSNALFSAGLFILLVNVSLLIMTDVVIQFIPNVNEDYRKAFVLIPVSVLFIGLWQLVSFLKNRNKEFGSIAVYQVTLSVLTSITKVVSGLLGLGGSGMIAGVSFSQVLSSSIHSLDIKIKDIFRTVTVEEMKSAVRQYIKFPLFSMPKNVISSVSNGLPSLILIPVYGSTEIGFYGLAITIGYVPVLMLSSSIYQVMLQRTSERINNCQEIYNDILKFTVVSLSSLSIIGFLSYYILPYITEFLFGSEWRHTGEILVILLPWIITSFVAQSLVFVPETLLKLSGNLLIEIIFVITRLGSIIYGIYNCTFMETMFIYSVTSSVIRLGQIGWYLYLSYLFKPNVA